MVSLTAGCVVQPPAPVVRTVVQPAHVAVAAPPVVSVYVDPPLYQPPPIAVAWAPPPMLVEVPPPPPFAGAVWTGGYWTWQGNWVWAAGRWSAPPQPGYGRLAKLARTHQVIVVTHLPQVAAFADTHLVVDKVDDKGGVVSSGVRTLSDSDRVVELARMLAGLDDTETGRAHAEELLEIANAARVTD